MTKSLKQLAHSKLLPESLSKMILAGHTPPMSDLTYHLVIVAMDAEVMTSADAKSSWTERRISLQLSALTFLTALLLESTFGPDGSGAAAVAQEKKP
jgi:phosphohistidine phosphatase SixA